MILRGLRSTDGRPASRWSVGSPQRSAVSIFLVNLFILFHLAAFVAWCLPIQSLVVSNFKDEIKTYMLALGLFQGWDMFAPDPLKLNIRVGADITLRDGRKRTWDFPRMDQLGFVERYYSERYRKYATEYLRADGYEGLRPDAARYIARLYDDPSNPPVRVTLYRSWSEIRPPGPDGSFHSDPWTRVDFFTYAVIPGDLQ